MSTVRLWRTLREYRKKHYRNISSIFPLQYERKISAYAPLMFPSWTAKEWLSPTLFVNVLSLNFLRRRGTRQKSSTSDFVVCMEMTAWVSTVSEFVSVKEKKPKTVPSSDKVREIDFWDSEGCMMVDFLEECGNDPCNSLRSDAQQISSCSSCKTSETENCHPSTWQREASYYTSDLADNSKERLGTALPVTLQSGFGPSKDHLRGHYYETDEAVQEARENLVARSPTGFRIHRSMTDCFIINTIILYDLQHVKTLLCVCKRHEKHRDSCIQGMGVISWSIVRSVVTCSRNDQKQTWTPTKWGQWR
jgi:hypothetical protein